MEQVNITISSKEDNKTKARRRKYNNKLIKIVKEYVKEHDFNFIQALTVLSIVSNIDRYNEDSEVTFHRVQNRLQQIKNMQFHAGVKERT